MLNSPYCHCTVVWPQVSSISYYFSLLVKVKRAFPFKGTVHQIRLNVSIPVLESAIQQMLSPLLSGSLQKTV